MEAYSIEDFDKYPTNVYQGYDGYSPAFLLAALIPVDFEQDRDSGGTRVVQMYAGVDGNVTGINQVNYPNASEINLNDTSQTRKVLDVTNNYNEQGILFKENDILVINTYDNNIRCQINVSGSYDGSAYGGSVREEPYAVSVNVDGIYYRDDYKYSCNISTDYGFQPVYDNVFQFLNDAISNGYGAKLMYLNLGDLFYEFDTANRFDTNNIYF
jgi:hypothetical protein